MKETLREYLEELKDRHVQDEEADKLWKEKEAKSKEDLAA